MATSSTDGHGDVFAKGLGAMIVHVQREAGLAHRTFVLRPWQVRVFHAASHRGVRVLAVAIALSWGYFAFEAARVPVLTTRIEKMERDALRLDTLELTLKELQARYAQVQEMLRAPAGSAATPAGTAPTREADAARVPPGAER